MVNKYPKWVEGDSMKPDWLKIHGNNSTAMMHEWWAIKRPWWFYAVTVRYLRNPERCEHDFHTIPLWKNTVASPTLQDLQDIQIIPEHVYPKEAFERMFNMTKVQVARWFEAYEPKAYHFPCQIDWIKSPRITNKFKAMGDYSKEQFLKDECRRATDPRDDEWYFYRDPDVEEDAPSRWKKDGTYTKFRINHRKGYTGQALLDAVQKKRKPRKRIYREKAVATTLTWEYFGLQDKTDPLAVWRTESLPIPPKDAEEPPFTVEALKKLGVKPYVVYPEGMLQRALGYKSGVLHDFYESLLLSVDGEFVADIWHRIPGRYRKGVHRGRKISAALAQQIIENRLLPEDELEDFTGDFKPDRARHVCRCAGFLGADILRFLGDTTSDSKPVPPPPLSDYRMKQVKERIEWQAKGKSDTIEKSKTYWEQQVERNKVDRVKLSYQLRKMQLAWDKPFDVSKIQREDLPQRSE